MYRIRGKWRSGEIIMRIKITISIHY
ncbi:hypothetical protein CAEBREN_07236 [Caenorhabditis brenneri]|uniref:Uncharacterized protein n=1 Tax=Caenorhabditis brenneri TaxID=135651 RepID=G0N1Q5_CAEBE|nr:hypothetical protein CAEBREN_07236 [Caenorhabditis brenneri]